MQFPDTSSPIPRGADPALALRTRHAQAQAALGTSAFGEPLCLRSIEAGSHAEGEVLAELAHPLAEVAARLRSGAALGALLFLHQNVRACHALPARDGEQLTLTFGPKQTRPDAVRYAVDYLLRVEADRPDYLRVVLQARREPLAMRGHRIEFEAVSLPERVPGGGSFVRVAYAHDGGLHGRLALQAYLTATGDGKIGFTSVGQDDQGRPVPVRGERGVLERNVMRCYLALKASLAPVVGSPAQALRARLRLWHGLTERYPAQLHELSLEDYLAEKAADLAAGALDPADTGRLRWA